MNDAQSNRSNDSLKHGAYICPYDPNEARPEGYTNSYNSSGNNNYLPLAKPIAEPDPEAGIIPAILLNLAVLLVIALSVAFPPLGMVIALAALSVIVHSLALGAIEASSKSFQNSKNNPNEGSITPTVVESGAGLGRTAVEQNQTNVPRQAYFYRETIALPSSIMNEHNASRVEPSNISNYSTNNNLRELEQAYLNGADNNYPPPQKPKAEPEPADGLIAALMLYTLLLLVTALSIAFPPFGMLIALVALSVAVYAVTLAALEAANNSSQNSKNNPNEASITPTVLEPLGSGRAPAARSQNHQADVSSPSSPSSVFKGTIAQAPKPPRESSNRI